MCVLSPCSPRSSPSGRPGSRAEPCRGPWRVPCHRTPPPPFTPFVEVASMPEPNVNRRNFLKTTAAGATALSLTAASANRVLGANERLRIAFLGVGGRCQQHIDTVLQMIKEGKPVQAVAVCDVWDGDAKLGSGKGRGLFPSAKRCGIKEDK